MTAKLHLLLMSIYNGKSYGKLKKIGWQLRAPPTGGAANHYFVLELHLRLRVFWAVAPSPQADLCMI